MKDCLKNNLSSILKPVFMLFLMLPVTFITSSFSPNPVKQNEDEIVYTNHVYNENIKSVTFYIDGLFLSLPIISLSENDRILFSFDDLEGDVKNYFYTVELCNSDWTPSYLPTMEYIDGYESNPFYDYNYSSVINSNYTHYKLTLPNDNLAISKAGNYILKVYLDNDPEDLVITQRFYVLNRKVKIDGQVRKPTTIQYAKTHQEIIFNVRHENITITNPFETMNANLMQNNRPDNMKMGLQPTFIRDNTLVYSDQTDNVFPSLKEFRWADLQSLIYFESRIKYTELLLGIRHIWLTEDPIRSYEQYFYRKDINGKFFINTEDEIDRETQSQYVLLHFTLPFDYELSRGNLYVMGAFTNWEAKDVNKMTYNYKRKAYECAIMTKQGYYNYMYGYKENGEDEIDFELIEGYYFDSENDYTIFIYHRPFGQRYDALIGVKTINSYLQ
jgi:Type 9 secretion system plug protein 1st domain